MFPDGSYGISLYQAATLLEIKAPKTSFASRLKRIQPEGYETTKNYVSGVSRAQGTVSLDWLESAIVEAALSGNQRAQAFVRACTGTTLTMYLDHAFGVQRTTAERVTYNEVRAAGKLVRHSFTKAIKDCYDAKGEEVPRNLYRDASGRAYKRLFGMSAAQIKERGLAKDTRDNLTAKELKQLERYEDYFVELVERHGEVTVAEKLLGLVCSA